MADNWLPNATPSDTDTKRWLLNATLATFRDDGTTIPTVMIETAQLYGKYIEGEEDLFKPPVWMASK